MDRTRVAELDELRRRITQIENRIPSQNHERVDSACGSHAERAAKDVRGCFATSRQRHDASSARVELPHQDAPVRASESSSRDAFARIERLVSFRDFASEELRKRLAREGYDEAHASEAIDRALRCGLVDDLRFADAYVRGRLSKGQGVHGIEAALTQLNIDASALPGWPEEYLPDGEGGELDRALALLDAKPPRSKNLREGAYRRLVLKGFSSDVAASAARRWAEAIGG